MNDELFDVCDANDQVLHQAPRSVVHANRWLHRAVHVFVLNSSGQLLLQKRSATKDSDPLTYTSSASGHVDAGEDYDTAALRELEEELGLAAPLERLAKFPASPETCYEHTVVYRTLTDAPPTFRREEIETGDYYSLPAIEAWLAARPAEFSQGFGTLFAWYRDNWADRPYTPTILSLP